MVVPKSAPANGMPVNNEKYKLVYFGSLLIDKRYTSCMLPWIVAEIKRKCVRETLDVYVDNTKVVGTSNNINVEHSLVSISKCIKLEGKEASTFAYLTKDKKSNATCSCHVFEAENTSKASRFLMTLKSALEDCKRRLPARENAELSSCRRRLSREERCMQYNVTYVGKLAVSHRKAPPTLIDTSVERFRHHNQQILLTSKLNSMRTEQNENKKENENPSEERHRSRAPVKAMSVDEDKKEAGHLNSDDILRPRSVSDGSPSGRSLVETPTCESPSAFSSTNKSSRKLSFLSENRSLVMNITVSSVAFTSSLSGRILMERKVQEISFCQQGTIEPEHFGFICNDPRTSHYHCYVFRAESKSEVDKIMKSLKQAFNSAWQAVGSIAACENCPLHKLHLLCQLLEGEKPVDQEILIRQHLADNFGDSIVDELRKKNQVELKRRDVVEQNEIMMSLLRQLYEEMQKVHRHLPGGQVQSTDASARDRPPNKFIAKAKRSLGDIFRSKARSIRSENDVASFDETDQKVTTSKPPLRQKAASVLESRETSVKKTDDEEKHDVSRDQHVVNRRKRSHRRSYSDISQVLKSSSKPIKDPNDSRDHVSDEETFVVEHPQCESSNSSPRKSLGRKQSYRRAIFDSVVTPSKLSQSAEGFVTGTVSIPEDATGKKSGEQLRALWRKAIMEQRLLIRMEKENSKLRAGEGIAKNKRLKLEYDELLPSDCLASETWSNLLSREDVVDKEDLIAAVKRGVPKNRRGEIWRFLLKQDSFRYKRDKQPSLLASYKELKEMTSLHQHAILIDCNRTFPAHPYFSQHVGVGQFALFNLLKVYSNLDPELGYCQGLSFVAGIILMHLGEEEAFEVLKHLNFYYGLRKQYMPDMAGLRVQFYQYSRLLHDAYPDLHDHLENYEVTPTLYAASWFLTLFASLFPVSFACRVLDLLCLGGMETIFKVAITLMSRFQEKILSCESLESIVDFLKVDLPKLAVDEQESIVSDVLVMDIGDKLFRFEVEYQVFQEEEINPSLLKPLLEKTEKLVEENKNLRNRQMYFKNELKQSQDNERILRDKVNKLEAENARLRSLIVTESSEQHGLLVSPRDDGGCEVSSGDVVVHSNAANASHDVENCTSPKDDNSDSFEHVGVDETDDEVEAISCDSPLMIHHSISHSSSSPDFDKKTTKL